MSSVSGLMAEAARRYAAGRSRQALRSCEAVLRLDPAHGDARHLQGVLLLDRGDVEGAVAALEQAAALLPGQAQVLYHLGNALLRQERFAEAEGRFRAALDLARDHADARNNLGNALLALERYEDAVACYDAVLSARPGFPPAQYNLGSALLALDRPARAEARFRVALAGETAHPDLLQYVEVWTRLGITLMALARHAEALDCFEAALARDPRHVGADWNRALALLSLGRLTEAWAGYERRWDLPDFSPPEPEYYPTPRRRDPAAMHGRRVLLRYEQGHGDTLHFVRYAPLLAARGAEVHLLVQRGLGALLSGMDGVASVREAGETPPACDAIWPLVSLPGAFRTGLESIPAQVPYLRAPTDRLPRWRDRIGTPGVRHIGLAWSGAAGHAADRRRSIPAARFAGLLSVPGCRFHLLQTEVREADREWLAGQENVVDHGRALSDYAETAAAVSLMDLVITVDTGLAHLAGALAKPVWILVAFSAEWRWLTDRTDSPWYPTARLFRQKRRGDWDGVLADVEAALRS